MNNYGLVLDEIGFFDLAAAIMEHVVTPMARFLYLDYGPRRLSYPFVCHGCDLNWRLSPPRFASQCPSLGARVNRR